MKCLELMFSPPGPNGESLDKLAGVEPLQMRGRDTYTATITRSGGNNGDTYYCMASNGASTSSRNYTISGTPIIAYYVYVYTLMHTYVLYYIIIYPYNCLFSCTVSYQHRLGTGRSVSAPSQLGTARRGSPCS